MGDRIKYQCRNHERVLKKSADGGSQLQQGILPLHILMFTL